MIYIDPPYNTGQDFLYEDDFSNDLNDHLSMSGVINEDGNKTFSEEQWQQNSSNKGRFHSDWMSMIFPRLKLARNLLRDDGVIIISIDDCEFQNLRKICEEVFGEDNFIDNIIWKKRYGGGAKEKYLVSLHEYALVFAKNISSLENFHIPLTKESIKRYYKQKDKNFDKRGPYRTHPLEATKSMGERKNLIYPIVAPDGTEVLPERQWLWGKERAYTALQNGELEFVKGKGGKLSVHTKQYLRDEDGNIRQGKPFSIIDDIFTQHGTNEMIELFGNAQIFPFPKPSMFMQKLINIGTPSNSDGIVLDFFCGSASTAHAVLAANAVDGGNRKFILVQLPELTNEKSEANKAGYKNIAEISKERIRRAGVKILQGECHENWDKDIGFRVLKIDTSNMADVYYTPDTADQQDLLSAVDNIKPGRDNPEDLLFQVLLDWGVDLSLPIRKETIQGKTVLFVDENALVACFDTGITEDLVKELAGHQPLRVVFRDNGFTSDAVKINVDQIFKQLSPGTEVKSI